jgi:hypothetical protein
MLCNSIETYIQSKVIGDLEWTIKLFRPLMSRRKFGWKKSLRKWRFGR